MSDKIIAMANEAGFFVSGGWVYSSAGKGHHINESLSRFRDLVLEEAALELDKRSYMGDNYMNGDAEVEACADAIRALKESK